MFLFQSIFGLPYYIWFGIFLLLSALLYIYYFIKRTIALAEQKRISDAYYDYLYPNDIPTLWEDEIENAENSEQVESLVDNAWTAFKDRKPLPKEAFEASKKKVLMWGRYFRDFGFRDLSDERLASICMLLHIERIALKYNESVFSKFFGQPEQRESFPKIAQNYNLILDTFYRVTMMNAGELNFIEERLSKDKWQLLIKNALDADFNGSKLVQRTQINNQLINKTD
jgi:hypothetical protein